MSYTTLADLITRFGKDELVQLSDRQIPLTGVIVSTVVDRAIADADAEIDAHLGGRYQLPLASVPVVIGRVACNLARYHLYNDNPTDEIRKRYEDGLKFLRDVRDGKISMGLDESGGRATPSDGAEMNSAGTVFGRKDSGGFI